MYYELSIAFRDVLVAALSDKPVYHRPASAPLAAAWRTSPLYHHQARELA